ncbi:alpha/beta hydrolase [Mycoplasmatota bacterium]|nr:alpha/beta hydrolase [Mycoplasmatota bacterium]
MKKIFKRILLIILVVFISMIVGLKVYTLDSSKPTDEMYDAIELIDTSSLTIEDKFDHISYLNEDPIKNIVFIPGGKVDPSSYAYLAINLAIEGYDVTIVKTLFNLAILTPQYGKRFLNDNLDNVVIGHSLGGTVASMFSSKNELVDQMVFLASYPIKDVSDKDVLMMTAEFDGLLDLEEVETSKIYLNEETTYIDINGGNHAQFGWYGEQKGDKEASITTKVQQDLIINYILEFIR